MKTKDIYSFFSRGIWEMDLSGASRPRRLVIKALRPFSVAVRELYSGRLALWATSFVYTTLLSIVPLLAVSFSVLKAFGVHNLAEPILLRFLAPLGPAGVEITDRIMEFVGKVRVGVLGSLGLLFLVYTVVSLVNKMGESINEIWRVKKQRSLPLRFSEYLSIIIIGPILIFTAIALTAAARSTAIVQWLLAIGPVGTAFYYAGRLVPYVAIIAAFTFIYAFMPNTRVRLASALFGGVFAGVLWEAAGLAFTAFVASSAQYSAIYSGFAILVVFMMWMYFSWLIFLLGAAVSFYHQHPEYMTAPEGGFRLSGSGSEQLAVAVMSLVGESHYYGNAPWAQESIAKKLSLPGEPVQEIIRVLKNAGFLAEAGPDSARYFLPGKDIERIKVKDVLKAVRKAGREIRHIGETLQAEAVVEKAEEAVGGALGEMTVKDLVLASPGEEKEQKKAA